jgi:hypothetical protein
MYQVWYFYHNVERSRVKCIWFLSTGLQHWSQVILLQFVNLSTLKLGDGTLCCVWLCYNWHHHCFIGKCEEVQTFYCKYTHLWYSENYGNHVLRTFLSEATSPPGPCFGNKLGTLQIEMHWRELMCFIIRDTFVRRGAVNFKKTKESSLWDAQLSRILLITVFQL